MSCPQAIKTLSRRVPLLPLAAAALLLHGCTVFDQEYTSAEEQPLLLGVRATPADRNQNACVVEAELQLRSVQREPSSLEFWYQTPELEAPLYPPNLTHRRLLSLNRCHIQGAYRLRNDGYMVFSANSQDQPRGEGDRKWRINNCPSIPTELGGGAHLFIARLGDYESRPGYAWGEQLAVTGDGETALRGNRIVNTVLLSTDDGIPPTGVGSLVELYHPGGIDGVGDFLYVGFDGKEQSSYLKIFDMADPMKPILVGGRPFPRHKSQALGTTALPDGRVLLAVVDTNLDPWKVHFYIESINPETGRVDKHNFVEAGTWTESDAIGRRSQQGFPFLKYQSLALLSECGSGEIFMIGVHNDRRLRCGGLIEVPGFRAPSRVDMYRLDLPDELGADAVFGLEQVLRRNLKDNNGEGCAAATAHITPEGQIVAYTMEHGGQRQIDGGMYDEGLKRWVGRVPFYEYRTGVTLAVLEDDDAVAGDADMCPDEAEDPDGFLDGDGCPDYDNDGDAIPDLVDSCRNMAEDRDGIGDGDGCAETGSEELSGQKIVLSADKVFDMDNDLELSTASKFLISGIVDWWNSLEGNTGEICVTGHVNRYGDETAEQAESEIWADIIAAELVNQGLSGSEVQSRGAGSRELLIAPADTEAEHINNRIEFSVCG